jgi:hypothetical protein
MKAAIGIFPIVILLSFSVAAISIFPADNPFGKVKASAFEVVKFNP